ncbi:MAG: hypothetical protein JXB36_06680 [Gammaproteobacteria bacterium]|nr:hypothetical protein [Gammaproteobacteria bacterium]
MIAAALRTLILVGSLAAGIAAAQVGHPAKGSWLGYWGPDGEDRRRILLVLDWENREIVGTINPGRNAVRIDSAEIDYSTWTMTLEARMPVEGGGTTPWVATGKLENLGSWVNRRWSGTYTHGGETGTFLVTLN